MLSVICWKWKSHDGYTTEYTSEHVNVFAAMLRRNLTVPHRLFCVTDDPSGLDPRILYTPLWNEPDIKLNRDKPNCYRRLKIFSKEAREMFGERILSIDLDCVILANINSLVTRDEDFVGWYKRGVPYQGSMTLHRTGTRTFLWDDFDPATSPMLGASLGYVGSDQAWVSAKLPKGEGVWTPHEHGVLSYKVHVRNHPEYVKHKKLPENAKIVFFHGPLKPWHIADDFVKQHWRI